MMTKEDGALIAQEFPDFDLATLPEIPEGFICGAYHHDTCPLWYERAAPEPGDMMLAVDYADPAMREFPDHDGDRFMVHLTQPDRSETPLYGANDWEEIRTIVRYVRRVREIGLGFHPDTRGADYADGQGQRLYDDAAAAEHDALIEAVAAITEPYDTAMAVWKALGWV